MTIQRIEAGAMSPTVATLEKLAQALGIVARDLFPKDKRPTKKGGRR